MPIIFNLASWATKRLSLTEWMVDELHIKYQINPKQGSTWVDNILPLLDGWDEVAKEHRETCADAINAYLDIHGLVPTVVCSRSQEYWELSETHRMKLERAVEVQPLKPADVSRLLQKAGIKVEGLRQALASDEKLRELTTLPLMLNLMLLAYEGMGEADILRPSTLSDRQQKVLAAYVQRQLDKERAKSARYSPKVLPERSPALARVAGRTNDPTRPDGVLPGAVET